MEQVLGVVSMVVALVALFMSWKAYRQRERYHPQPKLVVEWEDRIEPVNHGLLIRWAAVWNHGDAAARDVHFDVDSAFASDGASWGFEKLLEPGQQVRIDVPCVDRVTKGYGGTGVVYEREGAKDDYKVVTPTLTIRWRQPPFDRSPKSMIVAAPNTPDVGFGRE